jgi:deoxyribodipyrimidine photolyase
MALPKLFQRIFWHNNTTPAIQEDNLNAMSKGLSDVDDRVIGLAGTIMEDVPQIQEDMEELEADMALIDTKISSAIAEANRATTAANNAAASVISAGDKALVSEGWAKGTQNGVPVGPTSPFHNNNSEYFKNLARSFTPQGYQDLVDDVDSLKETFTKNGAHNLLPLTLANLMALNTSGTWSGNT